MLFRSRIVRFGFAAAAIVLVAGCRNLDFGDNPGKDVPKTDPVLTAYPTHLRDGASQ